MSAIVFIHTVACATGFLIVFWSAMLDAIVGVGLGAWTAGFSAACLMRILLDEKPAGSPNADSGEVQS